MIGLGKCVSYVQESIAYATMKTQARVISSNFLIGESAQEIASEMKVFQNLNSRCKNNLMSFVLSPAKVDNVSDETFIEISERFLDKMGLAQHQSLIARHEDNGNPHIHIYINRIHPLGEAYKDSFIGKKTSKIADEIAIELGLTRAKEIQKKNELLRKSHKEQVQLIFKMAFEAAINKDEFFERLAKEEIEIKLTKNKQGKIQGYRAIYYDISYKASEIGNKFTLAKLDKAINKAKTKRKTKTKVDPIILPKPISSPDIRTEKTVGRKKKRIVKKTIDATTLPKKQISEETLTQNIQKKQAIKIKEKQIEKHEVQCSGNSKAITKSPTTAQRNNSKSSSPKKRQKKARKDNNQSKNEPEL